MAVYTRNNPTSDGKTGKMLSRIGFSLSSTPKPVLICAATVPCSLRPWATFSRTLRVACCTLTHTKLNRYRQFRALPLSFVLPYHVAHCRGASTSGLVHPNFTRAHSRRPDLA